MKIYIILLLKAMEVNQLLHHFKSVIQYFKSSGISLYQIPFLDFGFPLTPGR